MARPGEDTVLSEIIQGQKEKSNESGDTRHLGLSDSEIESRVVGAMMQMYAVLLNHKLKETLTMVIFMCYVLCQFFFTRYGLPPSFPLSLSFSHLPHPGFHPHEEVRLGQLPISTHDLLTLVPDGNGGRTAGLLGKSFGETTQQTV